MTNDTKESVATVGGGANWPERDASVSAQPAPDTIQNFIDEQRWRPIEEFLPKSGTYLLKGEGFVWEDFWRECANGDAYWEDSGDFTPTHFRPMPTGTPADVIQIAIDALQKLARLGNGENLGNSTGNVMAQEALAEIEAKIGEAK
jgi:hypothetical protein